MVSGNNSWPRIDRQSLPHENARETPSVQQKNMSKKVSVPKHLKGEAKAWYRQMRETYEDWEPEHEAALLAAAEQLQRAEEYREAIEEHGLIVPDRFGVPKENPAAIGQRAAMNLFRMLLRQLGIE